MRDRLKKGLSAFLPENRIFTDEPLSRHSTFKTGGPASLFVRVTDIDELRRTIRLLQEEGERVFLLGRGSNILADDAGFDGTIVQLAEGFDRIQTEGERLIVQAGASMIRTAVVARDSGLSGLEFASGIPGSVGGGVVMNAGAYGGEMRQVIEEADLLLEDGSLRTCTCAELELGYRTSVLKRIRACVVEVRFRLTQAPKDVISQTMEELNRRRILKQPLEYASAGSTFKRPEGHFAGQLIEEAGLKGLKIGDAQVSEKHCGFVINRGNATSAEIKGLIDIIQKRVYEHSGIMLELEVIYL